MYARDKQANFRVINSNIGPLKRLRHSADYEDKRFLYNDSLHAIELVNRLNNLNY